MTNTIYALFDDDGLPKGFYPTVFFPDTAAGLRNAGIPAAAIEITNAQWREFLSNQGLRKWDAATSTVEVYTPPVPVPTEADYARAIQSMLDAKAQERGYDSIATAVSYRDDPNATYAAEGKALFDWRSVVWTYAYAQLAAVQAGTRTQPSVADFVTEVGQNCPFSWPEA